MIASEPQFKKSGEPVRKENKTDQLAGGRAPPCKASQPSRPRLLKRRPPRDQVRISELDPRSASRARLVYCHRPRSSPTWRRHRPDPAPVTPRDAVMSAP